MGNVTWREHRVYAVDDRTIECARSQFALHRRSLLVRAFVLIVAAGIGCSILGGVFGFVIGSIFGEGKGR